MICSQIFRINLTPLGQLKLCVIYDTQQLIGCCKTSNPSLDKYPNTHTHTCTHALFLTKLVVSILHLTSSVMRSIVPPTPPPTHSVTHPPNNNFGLITSGEIHYELQACLIWSSSSISNLIKKSCRY